MRLHDRYLDEEQCQQCEDGGLYEAHEQFKDHDRHRRDERQEVDNDQYQYFSGKDVPKETK